MNEEGRAHCGGSGGMLCQIKKFPECSLDKHPSVPFPRAEVLYAFKYPTNPSVTVYDMLQVTDTLRKGSLLGRNLIKQ